MRDRPHLCKRMWMTYDGIYYKPRPGAAKFRCPRAIIPRKKLVEGGACCIVCSIEEDGFEILSEFGGEVCKCIKVCLETSSSWADRFTDNLVSVRTGVLDQSAVLVGPLL